MEIVEKKKTYSALDKYYFYALNPSALVIVSTIFAFYNNRRSDREVQFFKPFPFERDGRYVFIAITTLLVNFKFPAAFVCHIGVLLVFWIDGFHLTVDMASLLFGK